jgi:ferredoxin
VRERARRLLAEGSVSVVIGYTEQDGGGTAPHFVTREEDCDQLVFNERCFANLTTYLTKSEVKALGRPAIVSKGCDNRALNALIREERVRREDVHVVGVECPGMDKAVCVWCDHHAPVTFDGDLIPSDTSASPPGSREDPTDGMSAEERWDYWMGEFSRCIRCYACRQICPTCHCTRCLAEMNQPQWIDSSPTPRGNLTWGLIRAFHQVGRCVECGECERACPMDIPLSRLTRGVRELMRERFGDVPGIDAEALSPLASYREDDEEDFFQ